MYYIKNIILLTGDDVTSMLPLEPGLNIIYGQSNTGKSLILDCVDYLYGAKKHRFDQKLQVKKITLVLDVDGKNITMSREIDSNDIEVSSTVDYIEGGTYKTGNAKKSIGNVWLRLMGIEDQVKIIMTLAGKTQNLTLRTFSHTVMIDETRMQGTGSILAQGVGPNPQVGTPVLTSLLYLATGNNYLPEKASQDPKIKKAKREAVKAFVDRSMSKLADRKISELENFSKESPAELQKKVDSVIDEIGAAEGALEEAVTQSSKLAEDIYKIDNQIGESRMLLDRNNSLLSQYEADIRRLTFIVEGDIHHGDIPALEVCPFCNGQLSKEQGESCISAAVAEVEKIEAQIKDLRSVQTSIQEEIKDLRAERAAIISRRRQIDTTIRAELRPQISQLRNHLADYTLALNQYKAKELIEAFSDVLVTELEVSQEEDDGAFKFDLKAKFKEVFLSVLDKELKQLLEKCNYEHFTGVRFDTDDYDVVVNGHLKRSQGQGFRAFLNTILAVAIQNCLEEIGHYKPNIMVIDSPILSLKEKNDDGEEKMSETMKTGLFRYFAEHKTERQTIIIENVIPKLDYAGVNKIEFTKDETRGRYGLIEGYRD